MPVRNLCRRSVLQLFLVAICLAAVMPRAEGEDWPQFRGPTGAGLSSANDLPLHWGGPKNENVVWTADLLGDGIASPIVWKNRLFVLNTSRKADDKKIGRQYPEQYVACYDTAQGKLLWNTIVGPGPWKRGHNNRAGGGFANCTPATDGQRVYALFGTSVLAALDFDGKVVWRKELIPHRYDMEMATSPILFKNTVIVYCGMQGGSRLVAFDCRTGDIAWDNNLKDTGYGHNTPLIIQVKGAPQMVLMGAGLGPAKNAIQSFDPRTGERLWWSAGRGETASPVFAKGFVFCDSGRGGGARLVDPTGTGNVSNTHVKWEANVPHALSSPLVVGSHIYRLHDNNTLTCWDIETGKKVYQERVNGLSSSWASPVADSAGRILLANAGTSVVVEAGASFKVLATNKLGDSNHASPAISGGRLYLLGSKRLYAIGKQ
ncbi:MAG: PQQ-like beta-propeller repeat protein [Planctomycetes bacterium]|jgi:outer membrane protein assembly factor BamB|nr:PQQ-like beta-propeller repeat protein [Planctomycetota bacterium]